MASLGICARSHRPSSLNIAIYYDISGLFELDINSAQDLLLIKSGHTRTLNIIPPVRKLTVSSAQAGLLQDDIFQQVH